MVTHIVGSVGAVLRLQPTARMVAARISIVLVLFNIVVCLFFLVDKSIKKFLFLRLGNHFIA